MILYALRRLADGAYFTFHDDWRTGTDKLRLFTSVRRARNAIRRMPAWKWDVCHMPYKDAPTRVVEVVPCEVRVDTLGMAVALDMVGAA